MDIVQEGINDRKKDIIVEQDCIGCKMIGGCAFGGFTLYNAFMIQGAWKYYVLSHKIFQISGLLLLSGVSFYQFNAAYEIYTGKNIKHNG